MTLRLKKYNYGSSNISIKQNKVIRNNCNDLYIVVADIVFYTILATSKPARIS
ncbi:hypothetical protein NO004_90098 [Flavobacterium psychrophilum]|nr:hypothetical protein NO004_90098 [Flavobacterium psychrophilum]